MKLTSKQKMCVGVVCLGLAAVGIDRFVISAPKAQTPTAAVEAAKAPAGKPAVVAVVAPSIAERLRSVATSTTQPAELRDAFRPSSAWVAVAPVQKAIDEIARFRSAHRLNAVMTRAHGGMAVVDGKVLALGQTLDGFKLVAVNDRSATFQTAAGQVCLKITNDNGAVVAGTI